MRKIAVVTGTRADYGIYRSVLRAIVDQPSLELILLVTGMHLDPRYGYTVTDIEKDGFPIYARIPIFDDGNSGADMSRAMGKALIGLTNELAKVSPDLLLILGDRGEMLAAALAALHLNIPIAHMHGGEVSGTIDESIRHAITKLAHIHFPATACSAERIKKMGELPENIYLVGAAGLDDILIGPYLSKKEVYLEFGLNMGQDIILCIQHPVVTEIKFAQTQMKETLEALKKINMPTVLIYPNSDAGSSKMVDVIHAYEKEPWLKTYKSIPRDKYLGLMRVASVMVGNSSSGIIEAQSFGLPVINIGTRQQGRERGDNVIDVDYSAEELYLTIRRVLNDVNYREKIKLANNIYGNGNTGLKIADVLAKVDLDSIIQKGIQI